jgi:hypothetical protein
MQSNRQAVLIMDDPGIAARPNMFQTDSLSVSPSRERTARYLFASRTLFR